MAPNSYHLIQISIVEEYRIFRTINLNKNDDFVYSTKNVYFYFDVGLFLNKKTCIIDVMAVAQWRPMRQMLHFWNGKCNLLKANKIFFFQICLNSPPLPHFIQTRPTAVYILGVIFFK